jgi:predicted AlkP superfamily pyrophosphatase or phosphodiesterase
MCLFSRLEEDDVPPLAPLRWLGLLPRLVHERGKVRRVAAQAIAKAKGYDGDLALHKVPPELFTSLDIPEKEDLFQATRIGEASTFLQRAREAGLRVVATDWKLPEAKRVEQIEQMADADLAFLYLAGMDAILHADGEVSENARRWAKEAAGWIRRARKALSSNGRTVRTLVVGDHGMAKITDTVDPRPTVKELQRTIKKAFIFVDATMFRVGADRDVLHRIRAVLERLPGKVLAGDELRERGADTYRYGDLIQVLPEGFLFVPNFLGGFVKGMHGYDWKDPSARAAVLSDAPIEEKFETLEDIAPWVLDGLEI